MLIVTSKVRKNYLKIGEKMKILNFIVYSTLSVVIVSNNLYTMEDIPKMYYFDLDNDNNKQKVELQQEINNLQTQVNKKENEIKDWLENNTINPKYSINEHLDFIKNKLYYEEEIRYDILQFNENKVFKYFNNIGLHDIVNNHIVELCNSISLADIHRQLYGLQNYFTIIKNDIECDANSFKKEVFESYLDQLKNILINNNKHNLFNDVISPILCNDNLDYEIKCARESIIRLSRRLAECRYLFGCMHLICQYFELKDKINGTKEKLEQIK